MFWAPIVPSIFIGGDNGSSALDTVYTATINAGNGTVGAWTQLAGSTLPQALEDGGAAIGSNGYIYYIGGTTNGSYTGGTNTVYYAQLPGTSTTALGSFNVNAAFIRTSSQA